MVQRLDGPTTGARPLPPCATAAAAAADTHHENNTYQEQLLRLQITRAFWLLKQRESAARPRTSRYSLMLTVLQGLGSSTLARRALNKQ
jgi:hypothetical protein